jgi:hypothetical protein
MRVQTEAKRNQHFCYGAAVVKIKIEGQTTSPFSTASNALSLRRIVIQSR